MYPPAQETLWQAMVAVAHRQFVAFLVIWLAIGFSVTCQQHGIMTQFDFELHARHVQAQHHASHGASSASEASFPCSMGEHDNAPRTLMDLTTIGLIQDQLSMTVPDSVVRFMAASVVWPAQICFDAPVPPPRFV
jgi:hypothetical protein